MHIALKVIVLINDLALCNFFRQDETPVKSRNFMFPGFSGGNRWFSSRLAALSAGYDSRFVPFFYDAFGFLEEPDVGFLDMPKCDNSSLIDACISRARELSGCNFMFSGGVDSRFLLACFKTAGVPARLYNYCPSGIRLLPELRKFVEDNFDITYITDFKDIPKLRHIYMGSLSDSLFFSTHRIVGEKMCKRIVNPDGSVDFLHEFHKLPFVPLQDLMLHKFSFDQIELVLSYAAYLGVPLDDNIHIARFIDWVSCLPKYMCQASWGYFVGMDSFFNTQKFINIAFTQYWESNYKEYHDKKLFREFIVDTFDFDFGVKKNYT